MRLLYQSYGIGLRASSYQTVLCITSRNICNGPHIHWLEPRRTIQLNSTILKSLHYIASRRMATSSSSSKSGHPSGCKETASEETNSRRKPGYKVDKEELKARLSPIQYQVTQLKSTERPGTGEYNKFNKPGMYHCVVCDSELFKSDTKYDSGCGWPAFYGAADNSRLKFVQDYSLIGSANLLLLAKKADLVRTEVLCANCDAHLGHRFDDGPMSKGGKRYCINSAALRFEPAKEAPSKSSD